MNDDLTAIPSSSSDSGLSSALSLSCEQQLSPLLPIEEDQLDLSNDNHNSSQTFMDFDSLGSPNDSVGSVDSPVRSVMSSNLGSPATDVTEEMEFEPTLISAVDPNVAEGTIEMTADIIKKEPAIIDYGEFL